MNKKNTRENNDNNKKKTSRKINNRNVKSQHIKLTTSNRIKDGATEIGMVFGISLNILNIGSQFLSGIASWTGNTSGWTGITEHFENTLIDAKEKMIARAHKYNSNINKIIGVRFNTSEISGGNNKDGVLVVLVYGTAVIE